MDIPTIPNNNNMPATSAFPIMGILNLHKNSTICPKSRNFDKVSVQSHAQAPKLVRG
jgi:hypothetical protein